MPKAWFSFNGWREIRPNKPVPQPPSKRRRITVGESTSDLTGTLRRVVQGMIMQTVRAMARYISGFFASHDATKRFWAADQLSARQTRIQIIATPVQPARRCVFSKTLWWLLRMAGWADTHTAPTTTQPKTLKAKMEGWINVDPFRKNSIVAVTSQSDPDTAKPEWRPPKWRRNIVMALRNQHEGQRLKSMRKTLYKIRRKTSLRANRAAMKLQSAKVATCSWPPSHMWARVNPIPTALHERIAANRIRYNETHSLSCWNRVGAGSARFSLADRAVSATLKPVNGNPFDSRVEEAELVVS